VTLTASLNGTSKTTTFTVNPPDQVKSLTLSPTTYNSAHGVPTTLTVERKDLIIACETALGKAVVGDCLSALKSMPDNSVDLVITSPPYDCQPKYGNGESYGRSWYKGFFLETTQEVLRVLKPRGSFILNYRSKRQGDERGTLQYELVFWLREQGFLFCEDFVWGKPSPPPGRFNRFLKDAVEYCFQFAKTPDWQFFPEQCLSPARWDAKDRERRKKLAHNFVRANEPFRAGPQTRTGRTGYGAPFYVASF
jgi:hypothetical protein